MVSVSFLGPSFDENVAHLISVSNGTKWKPVMYSYSGEVEPLN